MNFRNRDLIAVLMGVCLIRMAWNDDNENSFTASFRLAFYTHGRVFSPFDTDGDGTAESLSVVVADGAGSGQWRLEILDLKALYKATSTAAPFRPEIMLQAPTISTLASIYPVKMVTGQIMMRHPTSSGKKKKVTVTENAEYTDRTRHYFCGTDWHDAGRKCGQPCPGGTPGECPDGETCYADTPCDALSTETTTIEDEGEYQLTPAGGLPSIVTLWSDGMVRLHAVTKDDITRSKKNMVLKELWVHNIGVKTDVNLLELKLLGDIDLSSSNEDGKYGVVVVGGIDNGLDSFMIALDVLTGTRVWAQLDLFTGSVFSSETETEEVKRGSKSVARRRSRLLNDSDNASERNEPNCWSLYKHSLIEFLPYAYWGPADGSIEAVHLDHRRQRRHLNNQSNQKNAKNGDKHNLPQKKNKGWHSRHAPKPVRGRPNVLLSRVNGGLKVRSLRNGRSICHLSLLDHVMYADINKDGTLDQIQALTSFRNFFREKNFGSGENDQWIHKLQNQLLQEGRENQRDQKRQRQKAPEQSLCHIMALSGIPAREELYSASLCDSKRDPTIKNLVELSAAPPLLVAPNYDEFIIALSNGAVSKHVAATGQKIWQGRSHDNPPNWGPKSPLPAVKQILPSVRNSPILILGETSMSMRSLQGGRLLDSTEYPTTPALQRPNLHQFDEKNNLVVVLVATPDAVWGYVVELETSTTLLLRIMVGFLFVFIAFALLKNKYNGGSRRSTDP